MTSTKLGKNVIVIVRAPLLIDPRDNSAYRDWANASETSIRDCMVEPFQMAEKLNFEDNRNREFVQTANRVYLPATTDIVYTDRLRFDGFEWQVLGHPGKWYDFSAKLNHIAVIARIRSG